MFPASKPEYIIYAAMKIPTWGKGTGLSNAVTDVIKSIAKYENLNDRDDKTDKEEYKTPSYINKSIDSVISELQSYGINPIVVGDGKKVVAQGHEIGKILVSGDKFVLLTNTSTYSMPNIIGWSKNDIISM